MPHSSVARAALPTPDPSCLRRKHCLVHRSASPAGPWPGAGLLPEIIFLPSTQGLASCASKGASRRRTQGSVACRASCGPEVRVGGVRAGLALATRVVLAGRGRILPARMRVTSLLARGATPCGPSKVFGRPPVGGPGDADLGPGTDPWRLPKRHARARIHGGYRRDTPGAQIQRGYRRGTPGAQIQRGYRRGTPRAQIHGATGNSDPARQTWGRSRPAALAAAAFSAQAARTRSLCGRIGQCSSRLLNSSQ